MKQQRRVKNQYSLLSGVCACMNTAICWQYDKFECNYCISKIMSSAKWEALDHRKRRSKWTGQSQCRLLSARSVDFVPKIWLDESHYTGYNVVTRTISSKFVKVAPHNLPQTMISLSQQKYSPLLQVLRLYTKIVAYCYYFIFCSVFGRLTTVFWRNIRPKRE